MNNPPAAIIATYKNKQDTVTASIESAINQNYDNKVIIAVDDNSKDDTWNILKKYVTEKTRYESNLITGLTKNKTSICLIRNKEDRGPGESKNIGLELCIKSAEYFMMLDGDDTLQPFKLKRCVDKIETDPGAIGLVYSDQLLENRVSNFNIRNYLPSFNKQNFEFNAYVEPNYLISKKSISRVGRYDHSLLFPDYDYILRIADFFVIMHIPEILSTHILTTNGLSNTVSNIEYNQEHQKVLQAAYQRRIMS